ncbi:MAG: hypothetical protein ACM3XN_08735 [Chloroflexota bacterium]
MSKLRVRVLSIALLAIASVVGLQLREMVALEAKIPPYIKELIMSKYDSGLVWRAYSSRGPDSFVAVEFRSAPESPRTNVDVYRISGSVTSPRLERCRLYYWSGAAFEAAGGYGEFDREFMPHRQYAAGVALDHRVVLISASTEDGRTTSCVPFDGYWWMTMPVDPADYSRDQWVRVTAHDSEGRTLYECIPMYPKLGRR